MLNLIIYEWFKYKKKYMYKNYNIFLPISNSPSTYAHF